MRKTIIFYVCPLEGMMSSKEFTISTTGRPLPPPGAYLMQLARDQGLTKAQLADKLGYTDRYVSQLIRGDVALTSDVAQRIADEIGGHPEGWIKMEENYRGEKK
jgi:plasmid maintenance system antidote protein VapI